MTYYRYAYGKIVTEEFVRVTAEFGVKANGRKEALRAWGWVSTKKKAYDFALSKFESAVEHAERSLNYNKKELQEFLDKFEVPND